MSQHNSQSEKALTENLKSHIGAGKVQKQPVSYQVQREVVKLANAQKSGASAKKR